MVINSGTVAMSGTRSYQKVESAISVTVTSKAEDMVKLDISDKSKRLFKQLQDGAAEKKKAQRKEEAEKRDKQKKAMENIALKAQKAEESSNPPIRTQEDLEIEMIRRILEGLRRYKDEAKGRRHVQTEKPLRPVELPKSDAGTMQINLGKSMGSIAISDLNVRNAVPLGNGRGQEWKIQTVTSAFFSEQEVTQFSTNGKVCTADGREISFGVSVEMSRSFVQETEVYSEGSFVLRDPLVINLDTNVADVKDMKFFFDLDADGKEEEISELGSGSGYLALDKNGDGIVNDGSELFGTKSGDGFAELAAYDEDGNRWIDEADDIFSKLKIWVKDENGKNRLLDLKEAGVGAIYLGNANTRFSLNNAGTNATNAVIQNTGVFLREDGTAGTVQHVDLAL